MGYGFSLVALWQHPSMAGKCIDGTPEVVTGTRKMFIQDKPSMATTAQHSLSINPAEGTEQPGQSPAWMLVSSVSENGTCQKVAVSVSNFLVGRSSSCHLTIADPTVSGRHAELLVIDRDLFIRDLNSTNGTLLNGRRVQNLTGLRSGDVLHFGSVMYTLNSADSEAIPEATMMADVSTEAMAQLQFDKLLKRPGLKPYYQPIVRLDDHSRVAFEVLSRSTLIGLETPDKMFRIAAQRTSEVELSIVCRHEGLRVGEGMGPDVQFYLNTHPAELKSTQLFNSLTTMREEFPLMDIVIEVHEAAVASTDFLRQLRTVVSDLGMKLAYDDFGAGQARLKELFDVPPDVLKFDVKFVNGLPFASPQQRATIQSLVKLVRDLNVIPLAEGVETTEEAACCHELGFELAQGYLFGRADTAAHWAQH
ncbi:MAG: EAL domain-containing protein [Planctomycetaceae bacterium]|nr:EAL domain-containing protein [Planctomycetaceae bacterium]